MKEFDELRNLIQQMNEQAARGRAQPQASKWPSAGSALPRVQGVAFDSKLLLERHRTTAQLKLEREAAERTLLANIRARDRLAAGGTGADPAIDEAVANGEGSLAELDAKIAEVTADARRVPLTAVDFFMAHALKKNAEDLDLAERGLRMRGFEVERFDGSKLDLRPLGLPNTNVFGQTDGWPTIRSNVDVRTAVRGPGSEDLIFG